MLLGPADQERLRIIVQVHMDAAPDWMGRKFADAHFVAINGQPLRAEAGAAVSREREQSHVKLKRRFGPDEAWIVRFSPATR